MWRREARIGPIWEGIQELITALWSRRHLVWALTRRQYDLRYRQSMMGFAWAVLAPLTTLGVATIVFGRVANVDTGGSSYTVFALAGLVPWTFLATAVTYGVQSVAIAQQVVTRLSFPRAALPISMVGVSLMDLLICLSLFGVFAYAFGDGVAGTIIWLPLLLLIEVAFITGIVLLGAAVNVFARDVRLAVPLLVQLWLFVTPVLYPLSAVPPNLRRWYDLNPMTGLVEAFRRVLVSGQAPDAALLAPALLGTAVALFAGTWYFAATESRFADVI